MFIEVTSKGNPLYLRVGDILVIGADEKRGAFIVTGSIDVINVKEDYETVKRLVDDAQKRMFSSLYGSSELKTCQNV